MNSQSLTIAAFALSDMTKKGLKEVASSLDNYQWNVVQGSIDDAQRYCLKQGAPDILIVDGGDCLQLELALSALAPCCPPDMKLVILGQPTEVSFFRKLLFVGVNDYHSTPLDLDSLRLSILRLAGQQIVKPLRQGRIICVVGSAGGVGTSMVAANLAWLMSEQRKQHLALIDLNVFHSQHPILLGQDYEPSLHQLLEQHERLDSTLLNHSAHKVSERLHLFYGQEADLPYHDEWVATIERIAEHYSSVIVDIPDLRHSGLRQLVQKSDVCIYLHDYSLNAVRVLEQLQAQHGNNSGQRRLVVGNLARQAKGKIPFKQIESASGLMFSEQLPFEPKTVIQAEQKGQPIAQQGGKLAARLQSLTDRLMSQEATPRAWRPSWRFRKEAR